MHLQPTSSVFANAVRSHPGGMAGHGPSEVPIIAQAGEEILSCGDPRNRLTGGGMVQAMNVHVVTPNVESFRASHSQVEAGLRRAVEWGVKNSCSRWFSWSSRPR